MLDRARVAVLLGLLILPVPVATAQEFEDGGEDEGEGGEALGVAAAWALGIVGATAVINLARRRILLPRLRGNKQAILLSMKLHRKVWLPTHLASGLATVVLGTWHGLLEEEGNVVLWGSMALFGFLTVGGAILAWKWTPASVRKGVYLLHSQQVVFLVTLGALAGGHLMAD